MTSVLVSVKNPERNTWPETGWPRIEASERGNRVSMDLLIEQLGSHVTMNNGPSMAKKTKNGAIIRLLFLSFP